MKRYRCMRSNSFDGTTSLRPSYTGTNVFPGDRVQFDMSTRITLSEPTFRFWYQIVKPTLNPDAVRYVDNLLAQPD
jgi:hypothetical protein